MPGDTIFKYSHLIRISDISQGVNHQELIGRKLFPQRLPSYCIFQDFARLFSCKDSVKWKITVDQNLCVEQKWIFLVTALQFVCLSSFSTVKRKVDKENYLDAHYVLGLAEIGQNGPKSQKRSRSVVFLCKIEF